MLKQLLLASLLLLSFAIGGLVLALGGCGDKTRKASMVGGAPALNAGHKPEPYGGSPPQSYAVLTEIGRDPAVLARLERPVKVNVTIFHAKTGVAREREAILLPGTWLLPAGLLGSPVLASIEESDYDN